MLRDAILSNYKKFMCQISKIEPNFSTDPRRINLAIAVTFYFTLNFSRLIATYESGLGLAVLSPDRARAGPTQLSSAGNVKLIYGGRVLDYLNT